MTVVYINVQYQTCPNHESDNHFFAKIPGGGPDPPRSPPLDPPLPLYENESPIKAMFFDQSFVFNPLPDMPILGSSNSKPTKDMMSKIWTNGDTII